MRKVIPDLTNGSPAPHFARQCAKCNKLPPPMEFGRALGRFVLLKYDPIAKNYSWPQAEETPDDPQWKHLGFMDKVPAGHIVVCRSCLLDLG